MKYWILNLRSLIFRKFVNLYLSYKFKYLFILNFKNIKFQYFKFLSFLTVLANK
jgi:hypothetical protein